MQVYLVGGAVRDQLLNRAVHEKDWVVVGGTPERMLEQGYRQVGKSFPVFLHPDTQEEYALARLERKMGQGHGGFDFVFDPSVSLEDDLRRRDLTINAMAMDDDGHITDPYGGKQDLEDKVLRHVSEAFAEDPLRVLRVARFAATLPSFSVHPETETLMQKMVASGELATLSHERLWREWQKALLAEKPMRFFEVLTRCGFWSTPPFSAWTVDWYLAEDLPQVEVDIDKRFAYLAQGLEADALKGLIGALKPPKSAELLSLKVQALGRLWWSESEVKTPEHWLAWCEKLDGLRRPDFLQAWVDVMQAWARLHQQSEEGLMLLVDICKQVQIQSAKPFIAKGLEGVALGQAIRLARIQTVAAIKHPLIAQDQS